MIYVTGARGGGGRLLGENCGLIRSGGPSRGGGTMTSGGPSRGGGTMKGGQRGWRVLTG